MLLIAAKSDNCPYKLQMIALVFCIFFSIFSHLLSKPSLSTKLVAPALMTAAAVL